MTEERSSQTKINNLDAGFIRIFNNVQGKKYVKRKDTLSMGTTRRPKPDGFYLLTVEETNESHGIFIFKDTTGTEPKFYIFDPNGRYYANSGYSIQVSFGDKTYDTTHIDKVMSPTKSWNDHVGYCGLWCLITIVLWNSFPSEDRWTALELFDKSMQTNRKNFIDGIYNDLIKKGGDYITNREVEEFINEVRRRIHNLPIVIRQ